MVDVNSNKEVLECKFLNIEEKIKGRQFLNKLHFFYGETNSGKSTLLSLMVHTSVKHYLPSLNGNMRVINYYGSIDAKLVTEIVINRILEKYKNYPWINNFIFDEVNLTEQSDAVLDNWDELLLNMKENKNNPMQQIWIFDDMLSFLIDVKKRKLLTDILSKFRQFNITLLFLVQQITSLPTLMRTSIHTLYLCGTPTQASLKFLQTHCPGSVTGPYSAVSAKSLITCVNAVLKHSGTDNIVMVFFNKTLELYKVNREFRDWLETKKKEFKTHIIR